MRHDGADVQGALIWVVPDSAQPMREEARKILAWQAIQDEADDLKLDEAQKKQLAENIHKAKRDLKESIWRAYKHLFLLAKDNTVKMVDLGLVHSSAADTPISNILNRLSADGDVEKGVAQASWCGTGRPLSRNGRPSRSAMRSTRRQSFRAC